MKHQFTGTRCIHCGVSIAISGYSQECPSRPTETKQAHSDSYISPIDHDRIADPQSRREPIGIDFSKLFGKPGQKKCPRCNEFAWFNMKSKTKTTGYIGVEGPFGILFGKPLQQTSSCQVCSNCGSERNLF